MIAYKVKGRIDESGKLIVTEAIDLPPGEVEILVFPTQPTEQFVSVAQTDYRSEVFGDLLENTKPVPDDFDADQARWEALKEKYNQQVL